MYQPRMRFFGRWVEIILFSLISASGEVGESWQTVNQFLWVSRFESYLADQMVKTYVANS